MSDRPNLDLLRKVIGDVPQITPLDRLFSGEPNPYEILSAKESCAIFREEVQRYRKTKFSNTLPTPVKYLRKEKITPIALPAKDERLLRNQLIQCGIRDRVRNQHPGWHYFERLMEWIGEQEYWPDWDSAHPKMDHILVPQPLWLNLQRLYKSNHDALYRTLKSVLS
jgi:hypothetical protein